MPALRDGIDRFRRAAPRYSRWWLTLLLPYAVLLAQSGLLFGTRDASLLGSSATYVAAARGLTLLFVASFPLGITGLYFDRRYVAARSEWRPSRWYVAMFFLPVGGVLVLGLYLARRDRHVGLR